MKTLITWLVLTAGMITLAGVYFEYFVSRELPALLVVIATLLVIVAFVSYMIYSIKKLVTVLMLKTAEKISEEESTQTEN